MKGIIYIYFLYQGTTTKIFLKPPLSTCESEMQTLLAQKEINDFFKSKWEKLGKM